MKAGPTRAVLTALLVYLSGAVAFQLPTDRSPGPFPRPAGSARLTIGPPQDWSAAQAAETWSAAAAPVDPEDRKLGKEEAGISPRLNPLLTIALIAAVRCADGQLSCKLRERSEPKRVPLE